MLDDMFEAVTVEELQKYPGYPSESRFSKGMVAVIECDQEIPCNPCEDSCPHNAIVIGSPITEPPVLKEDLCTGCGLCVAGCPGQAIFMVDKASYGDKDIVGIPYEYLPAPKVGDIVRAANRNGKVIGRGEIVKVVDIKKNNKTKVVYIAVRKGHGDEVRAIVCGEK